MDRDALCWARFKDVKARRGLDRHMGAKLNAIFGVESSLEKRSQSQCRCNGNSAQFPRILLTYRVALMSLNIFKCRGFAVSENVKKT